MYIFMCVSIWIDGWLMAFPEALYLNRLSNRAEHAVHAEPVMCKFSHFSYQRTGIGLISTQTTQAHLPTAAVHTTIIESCLLD